MGAFTRARLIGDRKVIGQNNGQDQKTGIVRTGTRSGYDSISCPL